MSKNFKTYNKYIAHKSFMNGYDVYMSPALIASNDSRENKEEKIINKQEIINQDQGTVYIIKNVAKEIEL
jgi:hypothetical protein